jgi:AraC-like DNA-binding protein
MDVLTDLLERSRARGAAFSRSTVYGNWGLRFGPVPGFVVHVILDGEPRLWVDDPEGSLRLHAGDIVLVRGVLTHHLAHRPGARCVPIEEQVESRRVSFGDPDDGPAADFFCGAYMFEGDLCDGLLEALPDTVHLRPCPGSALRATMDLLAREMLRDEPGQQTLLDRLLDVALVQVIREHFADGGTNAPAWFHAQSDPQIGPALRALHADPTRAWTVADLAAEAHLSRATFARRFGALLGATPLAYLTDWRMALARERLRDTDDRLAAVARSLGYRSEFAFAAAFKRHHGAAPGRWRAATRAAA